LVIDRTFVKSKKIGLFNKVENQCIHLLKQQVFIFSVLKALRFFFIDFK
jgi:hypothetical protein